MWTIICLGIAAHFQSVLVSSDLSEYLFSSSSTRGFSYPIQLVSFHSPSSLAALVCSLCWRCKLSFISAEWPCILIMSSRLAFSFWRDRNPISTRVELACLGLLGILWLGEYRQWKPFQNLKRAANEFHKLLVPLSPLPMLRPQTSNAFRPMRKMSL